MKRIFHRYEKWEEYHAGMWRNVYGDDRAPFLQAAARLMINAPAFQGAMLYAAKTWTFSCEARLTNPAINHQAWIGHAGCCVATGSPEDITRQAWWTLNQLQQDDANRVADDVLDWWFTEHA